MKSEQGMSTETIEFFVKDTGIGILPENMSFIFTRFRQIDESNTHQFAGTGLGLSISKKLVELLGGELEVESVYNQGSTFFFFYPIREKQKSPIIFLAK